MVGIVVVSHSKNLAQEIINFSLDMAKADICIINAGGACHGGFGTDVDTIVEAIKKADDGDGVLIFVDLGSAVMSANMAIEFLEGELQKRVFIADAPILEGCIGGTMRASIGGTLEEVKTSSEKSGKYSKI